MIAEATLNKKLKELFGHDGFRSGQKTLVDAILSGRDALGIMPTGGGKSVCYQLPAMVFEGVTLVISPLISLMKDQIHSLKENGIAAAYINSTLTEKQIGLVLERAAAGEYKIIYVAPERLLSSRFIEFCYAAKIPFVAVDEAHCVSQWGQDFRPSYSAIPEFIEKFKNRPVVAAFTATATERVRDDIVSLLKLDKPVIEISGFDRKNLFFEVRHRRKKFDELVKILKEKKDAYGIVYCSTRKNVEEVCEKLKAGGFNAERYHAGLSDSERHQNQEDFIYDKINIIVATNAFGMGIDKNNVSFVIHYNMPKDIESYYQEAGRAGRDGLNANCILLYNGQDVVTNLFLIENSEGRQYESEEQKLILQEREHKRLKDVDLFCNTNSCLRNFILKYFGENPTSDCHNCGNCLKETEEVDITTTAQKIMSCMVRTNEFYGKNMIIDILRGSKNSKLLNSGLNKLSTYNVCTESENELKEIIHYLTELEYLTMTNGQYPIMKLGVSAADVLRGNVIIKMQREKNAAEESDESGAGRNRRDKPVVERLKNEELYLRLKELRRRIADEQKLPAYIIFHDSTLVDFSNLLPATLEAFSSISGVGVRKLEAYGEIFINEIKAYAQEHSLELNYDTAAHSLKKENSSVQKSKLAFQNIDYDIVDTSKIEIEDTHLTISEIAERINLCIEEKGIKKVSSAFLNDWLTESGLLGFEDSNESRKVRKITELGEKCGLYKELRMGTQNQQYNIILYSPSVQKLLKDNVANILRFRDLQKADNA